MAVKDAVIRQSLIVDETGSPPYNEDGRLLVASDIGNITVSAFNDAAVCVNRPFVQSVPSYNFIPSNFRTFDASGGSATTEDRKFKVSSGTSAGGYGAIQSFRSLNYKAGEGGLARFSGYFPSPAANSWSGIGLISLGDELSFGYNGTDFGIWHRYGGLAECRTLTISTPASGVETVSLTLNGTLYSIPVTSGTAEHNAYEIEAWLNDDANQSAWRADQLDDTVIICALSDGPKSGSYSVSSTGAMVGSIAQDTAGVTKTSDFIEQSSWSEDTMDTLDPSKGNVYQITYQDLQFGDAYFYIESPGSGKFERVHVLDVANQFTAPSLGNPSMRAGMYATNTTGTTNIDVYGGGFGFFMQGEEGKTRNPRAVENTQACTTSFTNILTLRNRRTYNGYINQVEIQPELIAIAAEGSKNIEIEIRTMVDTGTEQNFTNVGTNLVSDIDTTLTTAITGGRLIFTTVVAGGTSEIIDLEKYRIRMPPTLKMVIQGRVTGGGAAAAVSAALNYYEDV